MSKNVRIIPRLDIKGPNLVKGIHLEGLRVLGKPEDFAAQYYADGADELLYLDIVASLYQRNNLTEIVTKTAENIFIPLTAGGGIRTIEDIGKILRAGADKVAINTAAISNPQFISTAAKTYGSQCIVASIEAKRKNFRRYEAYTDNGRERTGLDVFDWAQQAVELGAGELLITSIDNEGTGAGYDVELISTISRIVPVPVITCGGAGELQHFREAAISGRADALSAASVFHYGLLKNIDISRFEREGNIEFIKKLQSDSNTRFSKIHTLRIGELKKYLSEQGIGCRLPV